MQEASFYEKTTLDNVQCLLCPHHCTISEGKKGSCGVRQNVAGKLYSLVYGKPCSLAVDPIEKKPLYHVLPGEKVFSLATVGCNLFCQWCQNNEISHPEQNDILAPYGEVLPKQIISMCKEQQCSIIAFTYTEPTIFYEYMIDIAKEAKKEGIKTVMVSNGYIEEEPLRALLPFLDAANIDLKCFSEQAYLKGAKAQLTPVLQTLKTIKESGAWLEITTLIVPGVNDDEEQLESLYAWIEKTLGADQVVHISKFFPYHQAKEKVATPKETLMLAEKIARSHMNYVYVGNVKRENNTCCAACGKVVIARSWPVTSSIGKQGMCSCGKQVPGIWK